MDLQAQVANMLDGGPPVWSAPGEPPKLPKSVGAVVTSSGSTGRPRPVVITRKALIAAAQAQQPDGEPRTWHLAIPARYIAGLMVLVRAAHSSTTAHNVTSDLADFLPTGGRDAISLVPTQLYRALQDPQLTAKLAQLDLILVGGAALAEPLRQRALDAGLSITETYGMTETCGGVVWNQVPLPGVEITAVEDERAPEGSGRLAVRGPMLFKGYLSDKPATDAVLSEGTFLTSDWGRVEHGRVLVGGRIDDLVITGGLKADLASVRRAVNALEPEAAVLSVPDEEWGARIVLVTPQGNLEHWRSALATSLPQQSLPRQVINASVPRTDGGKPDRARLEALVAA